MYAYAASGGYCVEVAARRHDPLPDRVPPVPPPGGRAEVEWFEAVKRQNERIAAANLVPINLPYAGESFVFGSPEETLDFLGKLRRIGYNIPEGAFEALQEEAKEMRE